MPGSHAGMRGGRGETQAEGGGWTTTFCRGSPEKDLGFNVHAMESRWETELRRNVL